MSAGDSLTPRKDHKKAHTEKWPRLKRPIRPQA